MTVPRYKWQPTTAEIAETAGIPVSHVERFDHNTSPVPTSWAAAVVAGSSSGLNEYPAASYAVVRDAVAAHTGLPSEWVIPGAGADELILLCGRAFLSPAATAVTIVPTYPLYAISAAQVGAAMATIPAEAPDFNFPAKAMTNAAAEADVVWLCIPNNPTGTRPDAADLRAIIEAARGLVVLDAAYAEFAGDDWTAWVREYDNLLVLHTMSKAFGLAGARVGYGLGQPDLVSALDGVRPPGSISSPSVDLAVAALSTPARMHAAVADLTRGRADLGSALSALGFRVLPSATNFLLCEVGPSAASLQQSLMSEGLVARKFPSGPLDEYLRFTVRTASAHGRLVDAIERNLP
jgi:histidinol-phosphate aminotransferase